MTHPHNNGHGLFRIPAHFFKILKSLSMDFQDTLSRLSFHSKDMITTTLISLKRYFPKQCETSHLACFACLLHARRLLCEPRIAWPLQAMGFIGRKRARDDATHGDMPSSTHLGNWLLTQVAWGGLSAHQCQQICQLVSLDFQEAGVAAPQEIAKFAALGSNGRYVNNCWRDLQRLFGANNFPVPKYITVPLVFGKKKKTALVPIMFPHEVFSALFHSYPSAFQKSLLPSRAHAATFWHAVERTKNFKDHPLSEESRDLSMCSRNMIGIFLFHSWSLGFNFSTSIYHAVT